MYAGTTPFVRRRGTARGSTGERAHQHQDHLEPARAGEVRGTLRGSLRDKVEPEGKRW
ncbi:exonuclease V subunit beta [Anopheles sinensis]|uniref:Exonuclease V subunit beta n=1 Tax=Anopheles sinensis TaxID=74873 RepID=A0A084VJE2_ANOSI|nr:exonuclease V subunit beta [Anopheles sinensis]